MIVETKSGKKIKCESAVSFIEKMRGLMFRKNIVSILFDFQTEGIHGIHSFFVPASFYAIYISSSGKVVDKFRMVPYEKYRENTQPARYLLETNKEGANFFKEGERVKIYDGVESTKQRGI